MIDLGNELKPFSQHKSADKWSLKLTKKWQIFGEIPTIWWQWRWFHLVILHIVAKLEVHKICQMFYQQRANFCARQAPSLIVNNDKGYEQTLPEAQRTQGIDSLT